MNTADQLAAFDAWLSSHPTSHRNLSAASFEDEETLRRSRRAHMSTPTTYRRRHDHPTEPWCDDLAVALGDHKESA